MPVGIPKASVHGIVQGPANNTSNQGATNMEGTSINAGGKTPMTIQDKPPIIDNGEMPANIEGEPPTTANEEPPTIASAAPPTVGQSPANGENNVAPSSESSYIYDEIPYMVSIAILQNMKELKNGDVPAATTDTVKVFLGSTLPMDGVKRESPPIKSPTQESQPNESEQLAQNVSKKNSPDEPTNVPQDNRRRRHSYPLWTKKDFEPTILFVYDRWS